MRLRTVAKLLILIMMVLFIFGLFRSCRYATDRTGLPSPAPQKNRKNTASPERPVLDRPDQTGGAAPEGPSGPPISELKPLQDVQEAQLERKRGTLRIWNVPEKSGDTIPQFPPVYHGHWKSGSESPKYVPAEIAGQNIFEKTTLSQISFLHFVEDPGDYSFTARAESTGWGINHIVSVRVNDVLMVPPTESLSTGYARLQRGWYRFDIRYVQRRTSAHTPSWSVAMKGPKQQYATVISTEQMNAER